MKRPCGFCGGPDTAGMVRRPYGCVCWSCAHYIDARGLSAASMIPFELRRKVLDQFNWGAIRTEIAAANYHDDGSDPFDFTPQEQQSNTSSRIS